MSEQIHQTDIQNLRFYSQMARRYEWGTDIIHHGVVEQTLKEIADRLDTPDPVRADPDDDLTPEQEAELQADFDKWIKVRADPVREELIAALKEVAMQLDAAKLDLEIERGVHSACRERALQAERERDEIASFAQNYEHATKLERAEHEAIAESLKRERDGARRTADSYRAASKGQMETLESLRAQLAEHPDTKTKNVLK